ncbi:MAG TPA: zf-HC2 domain-containing protein [Candidatus Saccharicenans sp.]|nr:zf-HC2 domain-containing protein [Candidatus Saccharicenans sp.]
MRCHQAQLLINKLLDAEIKETDYRQLKVHLDTCSKCRQIYEDLKAIKSGTKAETDGAVELEPSGEVWEKLKNKLEEEIIPGLKEESEIKSKREPGKKPSQWPMRPSRGWRYSVVLLIILGMMAGVFFLGRYSQQRPAGQRPQLANGQRVLEKIDEAGFYYRQAIESLTEATKIAAADKSFAPEMVEILQANLQLLDRTIDLCQQAVSQEPSNLRARDYLLSAYNSKLEFLNNMLETSRNFNNSLN